MEQTPDDGAGAVEGPDNGADDDRAEAPRDDHEHGGDPLAKLRREAASYRTKLREAEGERDALAERLAVVQRGEAERVATADADGHKPLNDGSDLWLGADVELEALLDDDGNVSAERVHETVARLVEGRPHWARQGPVGDADGGRGAAPAPAAPSFGAALKRAGTK